MERLQQTIRDYSERSASLASESAEAVSKDRLVTARIDSAGELVDIKFNTQDYRDMAPAELGAAIVDVVRRARAVMAERVAATYQPFAPTGVDVAAAIKGDLDPAKLFAELDLPLPPTRGREAT
ncbi:YbaB/EbfC family nucleoid-associated protein [Nocardiopsis protaetiae]|uniref:YbaB/EbfC family nucleoid-associated protein n=1 Tax=Nocardiopsis protaetiae TaxID=3382270 RepID=UPI00387B945D